MIISNNSITSQLFLQVIKHKYLMQYAQYFSGVIVIRCCPSQKFGKPDIWDIKLDTLNNKDVQI